MSTDVLTGQLNLKETNATHRRSSPSPSPRRCLAGCGGDDDERDAGARPTRRRHAATAAASSSGRRRAVDVAAPADGSLKFDQTTLAAKAGEVTSSSPTRRRPARLRDRGRRRRREPGPSPAASLRHRRPRARQVRVLLPGRRPPGGGHGGHAHRRVTQPATAGRKSKIAARSRATTAGARPRRAARTAARSGRCRASPSRRRRRGRTRACGARAVGAGQLGVDEAHAGLPLLDPREPARPGGRAARSRYSISAPARISIGRGVTTRKPSHGGRDRLEVVRVGEEREHLAGRAGEPLLAAQHVVAEHLHRVRSSVLHDHRGGAGRRRRRA